MIEHDAHQAEAASPADLAAVYTAPLSDDAEVRAAATGLTATVQEYLEAIYSMQDEGKTVIGVRLAERMRVAPSPLTATLQRMAAANLIVFSPHKEVLFTRRGLDIARIMIRRHRLIERFLTDIMGLEWHEAHEEACRIEHGFSPRMEDRVVALLEDPTRCPHGNPIPGLARSAPRNRMTLGDAAPGDDLQIERISEEAEVDPQLLAFLQRNGLVPDARLHVDLALKFNNTFTVQVGDGPEPVVVGEEVARLIWVFPQNEA
jgi:DtxR family transcriptional regulator, Mn-dependent transcriptional regulator